MVVDRLSTSKGTAMSGVTPRLSNTREGWYACEVEMVKVNLDFGNVTGTFEPCGFARPPDRRRQSPYTRGACPR